jgi:Condensation domain
VGVNVSKNLQQSAYEVEETYPMSPLQQGMLYHTLRAPGSGIDIEQLVCELLEALDVTVLQCSWQCVIARHPVLRTNFRWQGLNEPQQEVHSVVELPWKEQDWRDLPPDEKEKRSAAFLIADRGLGFDMVSAPDGRIGELPLLRAEDGSLGSAMTRDATLKTCNEVLVQNLNRRGT